MLSKKTPQVSLSSKNGRVWGLISLMLGSGLLPAAESNPSPKTPAPVVGKATYLVDPLNGDDANPAGKPWKTFGRLNAVKLARGVVGQR